MNFFNFFNFYFKIRILKSFIILFSHFFSFLINLFGILFRNFKLLKMVLQNDDSQLNETVQNEKPVYESALKYLAENSGLRRNRPGTSNLVSIY
jgi:hypothetical protein